MREVDQLLQSEERYRLLFDMAPGSILVIQDGRIVFANSQGLRLLGAASIEELATWPLDRFFLNPGDHEKARQRLARIAAGDKLAPTEYVLRSLDGRNPEIEVNSAAIVFSGRPAFLTTARDVTEQNRGRRQLEEQLRELRALHGLADAINRSTTLERVFAAGLQALRGATGAGRAAILLSDEAGVMRFAAWDGLSARYRAATEGHSPWAPGEENAQPVLVPDVAAEASLSGLLPVLRAEGIAALAFIPLSHQGRLLGKFMLYFDQVRDEFPAEETRLALTVAEQLALAVSRQRAMDEVQRLNAELEDRVRRRTAQLEAANREMESFCYSVSHDLRGPLRALNGFARILLDEHAGAFDGAASQHLMRIIAASRRMGELIDDLLSLSHIGRAAVQPGGVDLTSLARELIGCRIDREPSRRVVFKAAPDLRAEADTGLMRILLDNLLSNAWKYSAGREEAHIEFGTAEKAGRPAYFVRDNGAGFDMRFAGRLFSPFQRLHAPAEFEGNGIGLAIVERIVQRHGGRVFAESEPDRGATFWFTLWEDGIPADVGRTRQGETSAAVRASFRPSFPPA